MTLFSKAGFMFGRLLVAGLAAAAAVVSTVGAPAAAGTAAAQRAAVVSQRWDEARLRALYGSENRSIRTEQRVVALTFNAAWNDRGLDTVLSVLDRHKAPATFFLTGDFADRNPDAVRRIAAAGHGLGNHSYSHPNFVDLNANERASEVLAANRAIRAASGAVPLPFFRFPYGETTPQHIADVNELGFADIEFTTDTNGYLGAAGAMTADKAVQRALDALRPGAILQMHIGTPNALSPVLDAEVLPRIIQAFQSRGYQITDLRDLISK
ncbi:polysaccharide deacetylase family protein [Streptomyces sp. NBC_00322]|uniref:polysaccharide deacetylase family protein n=1 Tax=Streptomyces sp. NBC_00322 TaxID=2975712 RepID=UPI002E2D4FAC|nr:polysaccharide deacetylase family protein [Streptomyces sp. NBC_00322]